MGFPIRCYTCNCVVADKYPAYRAAMQDGSRSAIDVFREENIARMCCRRMFLGHVDLVDDQLQHPNVDRVLDEAGTVLQRFAPDPRTVSCD